MSGVTVVRAGLLTTIQDGGRFGLQHEGVPVSGPMDPFAMRAANMAVGNDGDEAALEVTLLGPELRFNEPADVAVAGADLSATVITAGTPRSLALGTPTRIEAGATLRFGERRRLARAYVAIRGGLDVPAVLGSRSTSMQSGFPGLAGRPLRAGDTIPIGSRAKAAGVALALPQDVTADPALLRIIWGPDDERFADRAKAAFLETTYRVSTDSNRMGYRLEGTPVQGQAAGRLLSEASPVGSVQIPPSGEPILLMADRQATGGYPRIGTVITADLGVAGQLAPGDRVRFAPCGRAQALDALRQRYDTWLRRGDPR